MREVANELIKRGLVETTPAASLQQGTTQSQRVFVGTLRTHPQIALEGNAKAPTLIIVGQVVSMRDKLAWFKDSATLPNTAELTGTVQWK